MSSQKDRYEHEILKELDSLLLEFQEAFKTNKSVKTQKKYLNKIFKFFWTKYDFNDVPVLVSLNKLGYQLDKLYFDSILYDAVLTRILVYITDNYDFEVTLDYDSLKYNGVYQSEFILRWKSYTPDTDFNLPSKTEKLLEKLLKVNKDKGIDIDLAKKISDEMFYKHGYYIRQFKKELEEDAEKYSFLNI